MAGRRSVWSNKDILAASEDFVASTDEVWRLQRGKDAESLHFQTMADQGHYRAKGGTRQGIYVLSADGTLLASINNLDAAKVLAMMKRGLEAWQKTTPAQRSLPEDWSLPAKRWEDSRPSDGLILRSFNADLGEDADRKRLNRDHVWFSAAEARAWFGADPQVGDKHAVPQPIVERLARFHLVDNVRGQTLPFAAEDVAASQIHTEVLQRSRGHVVIRITGETIAKTDGTPKHGDTDWKSEHVFPRGVTTRLLGEATYSLSRGAFDKFEFVAMGERTGRTNLNGRPKDDVGPAPIGWVFELAPDKPAEHVAPAFVDVYDVDWVVDPR